MIVGGWCALSAAQLILTKRCPLLNLALSGTKTAIAAAKANGAALAKQELGVGSTPAEVLAALQAGSTVEGASLLASLTIADVEAFDADGDGKFSESEIAAAAAAVGLDVTVTTPANMGAASAASSVPPSVAAAAMSVAATAAAALC